MTTGPDRSATTGTTDTPRSSRSASRRRRARLGWLEASLWMGATLPAWWRLLRRGHFRVGLSGWPACLWDGSFAGGNSVLRAVQQIRYRQKAAATELESDPIFIIGHWRTGTTWMHELLALDPRLRAPTSYECFVPAHFLVTRRLVGSWSAFVLPRHRPPDHMPMGWDRPQEDEFALCLRGAGSIYDQIAFPRRIKPCCPSLELERLEPSRLERWKRIWFSFLQELQLARPGRLLLKSPTHTFRLAPLTGWFPQARFVMMVRDPFDIYGSTCKLWRSLFELHAWQSWPDRRDPTQRRLHEFVMTLFERMHERSRPMLESFPPEVCHVVRFEEFVQAPLDTLHKLYGTFGWNIPAELTALWNKAIAERREYRSQCYALDGQTRAAIRARWRDYGEFFNYPVD